MEHKQTLKSVFFNGLITENPTFRLVLGTCPTMAVTTSAINGIGMGAAATFVLVGSNIVISLLRNFIPDKIRIPSFIIVICTFVTMVQMFMNAFLPALYQSLGIFLPLIVVNCIILGRAEAFASKNGILASAADGICQGLGYTAVLMIMSIFREFFGSGTFGAGIINGNKGIRIIPEQYPAKILTLPVGGFLCLACLIALMQWALARSKDKKEESKS